MNKYRTKGMLIYFTGSIEVIIGKTFKNSLRQVKGYQKQMTGKALIMLACAGITLRSCIENPIPGLEKENVPPSPSIRISSEI